MKSETVTDSKDEKNTRNGFIFFQKKNTVPNDVEINLWQNP